MFLLIQFPVVDARRFIDKAGLVRLPSWPDPHPPREFVRHVGVIRTRKLGGIADWVCENRYCDAQRALHFERRVMVHS